MKPSDMLTKPQAVQSQKCRMILTREASAKEWEVRFLVPHFEPGTRGYKAFMEVAGEVGWLTRYPGEIHFCVSSELLQETIAAGFYDDTKYEPAYGKADEETTKRVTAIRQVYDGPREHEADWRWAEDLESPKHVPRWCVPGFVRELDADVYAWSPEELAAEQDRVDALVAVVRRGPRQPV